MPRPTTKHELIDAAGVQWAKLWGMVDAMPEERRFASFNFGDDPKLKEAHWKRDQNLRDILIHLYEWHQLFISWTAANLKGETKPFLPEPYTWKTYGEMNVEFWKKHQSTSFEDATALLCESHAEVMTLIEGFSNEELFEKKHFTWTGTTTLGSYGISVSASHYDWAMKKIKLHNKTSVL
ncbi:MAG: ClbS/DfsB family four-helix bundle protein [Eggerthellaceae bacterium]|nr:ClbS/DfsB family four-helix bundle protein [Eggerthellaceae bacterium]